MSSKHRKTSAKHERARRILAFFLFLTISLLSLSLCVRVSFVSKSSIVNTFMSDTYIQGEYNSINNYARDLCDECSLPYECVSGTVTYDAVYKIQKAYINGILSANDEYTETTYKDYIENLKKDVKASTLSVIKEQKIDTYGKASEGAEKFAQKIADYTAKTTELAFAGRVDAVSSFLRIATIVAAAVLLLVAVIFVLFILSIGKKPYRAIRDIAYSFYAAALLNIILVSGVKVLEHFKTLVLFPRYLSAALMEYVNACVSGVGISAAALFVIGLVLTTVVWSLKRNDSI